MMMLNDIQNFIIDMDGSLLAFITAATGVEPTVIGKPGIILFQFENITDLANHLAMRSKDE
jgi:hypothetical protein